MQKLFLSSRCESFHVSVGFYGLRASFYVRSRYSRFSSALPTSESITVMPPAETACAAVLVDGRGVEPLCSLVPCTINEYLGRDDCHVSTIRLYSVRKPTLRPPVGLSLICSEFNKVRHGCQAQSVEPSFIPSDGPECVSTPASFPLDLAKHAAIGADFVLVRHAVLYLSQITELQIARAPSLVINLLNVYHEAMILRIRIYFVQTKSIFCDHFLGWFLVALPIVDTHQLKLHTRLNCDLVFVLIEHVCEKGRVPIHIG